MTPRQILETELRKRIPKAWKLLPYEDSFDVPTTTVVMLRQLGFSKWANAPLGAVATNFIATLVTPHTDAKKAEAQLDTDALKLFRWIDEIPSALATGAEKVQATTESMAYDIDLSVLTRTESE
ncbi:hypothetical protein [Agromyces atrinae]|uniref:Uncharacterized protein n=1 Tax=Agromyces atrinae TaxID=592376 RepID=A0A4Q2M3B6_9MICO|nr:hypothetical protein [Agromyces atrinae]NYD65987.1 hypothetical protein [Agromyces atrinae]RXZ86319.1 hypothetical protein ESP50_11215 [Agromyces atrinae]